ncbi:hypothetical protein LY78DRAFT_695882 [Colletotrichum sublineola]|nr:hypothetical protein LY78DRAFT_695882 [Colletotrichum sublineola]
MLVRLLLLAATALAAVAAVAAVTAEDSFILFAYSSGLAEQIVSKPQDFVINARHGRFWIGALQPTTSCPDFSGDTCPPGNMTVVDGIFRKLQVSKPGGQRVYTDPRGIIAYTPGGESSIFATPPGSSLGAFHKSPADSLPPLFGGEANLLRYYVFREHPGRSNIYACPSDDDDDDDGDDDDKNEKKQHQSSGSTAYLKARWTSTQDAVWDARCVELDGLLALPSGDAVGAYEYTMAPSPKLDKVAPQDHGGIKGKPRPGPGVRRPGPGMRLPKQRPRRAGKRYKYKTRRVRQRVGQGAFEIEIAAAPN